MQGTLAYRVGPSPEVVGFDGAPGVRGLRRVFWRLGLRLEPPPPELAGWYRDHEGIPRESVTDRRLLGHLATAPHQLGEPLWRPAGPVAPRCPLCHGAAVPSGMFFSDPGRGMGYGPAGLVHLHACLVDSVLLVSGS